jgi:hypothetical protein
VTVALPALPAGKWKATIDLAAPARGRGDVVTGRRTRSVGCPVRIACQFETRADRSGAVQSSFLGALFGGISGARAVPADGPVPRKTEVALSPGMSIRARTTSGLIAIRAGNGLRRSYTWKSATRSVEMVPRGERWNGSLGLHFPGSGRHWEEHDGVTRAVVEEGQQDFETTRDALRWIGDRWTTLVYRNDGLAVGWSKVPARRQLNVEVWQILVAGRKPTRLPGSDDRAIEVTCPVPPGAPGRERAAKG